MGSGDQGIRGTVGTEDQLNSGNGRPEEQWTRGPEDQRTRGTVGTVGTEDQRNSMHRGAAEQLAQRTRGTVSTEDQ